MTIRRLEVASPSLIVTPSMLNTAKENKAIGVLTMEPYDFLALTIPAEGVDNWIKQEAQDTRTLEEYQEYTRTGANRLMPFLDVNRATGKIKGHEGRHRAAALLKAGGTSMQVAITLVDGHGYKVYYEHPYPEDRERWLLKRFLTVEDVPNPFVAEFKSSTKFWSPRHFKPFYENTKV